MDSCRKDIEKAYRFFLGSEAVGVGSRFRFGGSWIEVYSFGSRVEE